MIFFDENNRKIIDTEEIDAIRFSYNNQNETPVNLWVQYKKRNGMFLIQITETKKQEIANFYREQAITLHE